MFRAPNRIRFPPRSLFPSVFRQPFFPSHLPPRPRTASSLKDLVDGIVEAVVSPGPPIRSFKVRHSKETLESLRALQDKGDEYKYKPPPSDTGSKPTNSKPSSSQNPPSNNSPSIPRYQFTHSYRQGRRTKAAPPTHTKSTHLPRVSAPATSTSVPKKRSLLSHPDLHAKGLYLNGSTGRLERVNMERAKKMKETPPTSPRISMSIKDFNPPSTCSAPSTKSEPSPSPALLTSTVGLGVSRIKSPPIRRQTEVSNGVSRYSVELEEDYPKSNPTKSLKPSMHPQKSDQRSSPASPELSVDHGERPITFNAVESASAPSPKVEVKELAPNRAKVEPVYSPVKTPLTALLPLHSPKPSSSLASPPSIDASSVSPDSDIDAESYDFSWLEEEEQYQSLLESESFYSSGQSHSLPWFLHPSLSDLSLYHSPNSMISRRAALQSIDNARSSALRSIREKLDLLRPPALAILEQRQAVDDARERERKVHLNKLEGKEILIEEQSRIAWTSNQNTHLSQLEKFKASYLSWSSSLNRCKEEEARLLQRLRTLSMFTRFYLSSSRQPFNLPHFPRSADQLYSARLYTDSTFTETYPVAFSKICQVSPYRAYTRGGLEKLETVEKRNRKRISKVWEEIEKIGRRY